MTIGFTAGMRTHRITVLNKVNASNTAFGNTTAYKRDGSVWSSYTFTKGAQSLREGTLDAYDSVMFQLNFSSNLKITRESLIELDGKIYQIRSLNADRQANKIVITAVELTTQVNIIESYSTTELSPITEGDI